VWDLPPTARGRALEQLLGHNLHPNYPTVDIWESDSGAVTSLKSIDLDSPAYRVEGNSQNALYSKLSKCVNDLAEFRGSYYASIYIPEEAIKSRMLTVIVPSEGTAAQQEVMRRIVDLGKQRGLTVNIKSYPCESHETRLSLFAERQSLSESNFKNHQGLPNLVGASDHEQRRRYRAWQKGALGS
jgi:hypothetical protein